MPNCRGVPRMALPGVDIVRGENRAAGRGHEPFSGSVEFSQCHPKNMRQCFVPNYMDGNLPHVDQFIPARGENMAPIGAELCVNHPAIVDEWFCKRKTTGSVP